MINAKANLPSARISGENYEERKRLPGRKLKRQDKWSKNVATEKDRELVEK